MGKIKDAMRPFPDSHTLKVKEMPLFERPREKAQRFGIRTLSNRELLALILRTGTKKDSVFDVVDRLMQMSSGIRDLPMLSYKQLTSISGISDAKATELMAITELSRRMAQDQAYEFDVVDQPGMLVNWLQKELGYAQQEHFLVIFLNTKNHIIGHKVLFVGGLDRSIVHPREIFKEALAYSAARIIAVHNHPSGDVTPSENDLQVTKILEEAGTTMGIPLLDHVIVSRRQYCSLRQKLRID